MKQIAAGRVQGARLIIRWWRIVHRAQLRSVAMLSTALSALALPAVAQTPPPSTTLPTGGTVPTGDGTAGIATGGTANNPIMTVTQTTPRADINWNNFSVGSAATVTFVQPSSSSITLNQVVTANPSLIAGTINANGQIAIINQSGVVFFKGSQVNVSTLLVSAAGMTAANTRTFVSGSPTATGGNGTATTLIFDQAPTAGALISSDATITIAGAGLASLVAPQVSNTGAITATLGHIILGGVSTYTLDLMGDGLTDLNVTGQVNSASFSGAAPATLVSNTGTITNTGGTVVMTAQAVDNVVTNLVTAGGTINAQTNVTGNVTTPSAVLVQGVGGGVTIEGAVLANGATGSGAPGGRVNVAAAPNVAGDAAATTVASTAEINASGDGAGAGGRIVLSGTSVNDVAPTGIDANDAGLSAASGSGTTGTFSDSTSSGNLDVSDQYNLASAGATCPTGDSCLNYSQLGDGTEYQPTLAASGGNINFLYAAGTADAPNVGGSSLSLSTTGAGGINIDGGVSVSADGITMNSAGTLNLDSALGATATFGLGTASDAGATATSTGALALTAGSGSFSLDGAFSATTSITLDSTAATNGGISETSGGTVSAASLTVGSTAGAVDLENNNNSIGTLQASSVGGALTLVDDDNLTVASAGTVTTGNSNNLILSVLGSGQSGGNSLTINGNVTGDGVTLSSSEGDVTQAATGSTVTATTLSGAAGGAMDLAGSNQISAIGTANSVFGLSASTYNSGNLTLDDNAPLTVGAAVTDGIGSVTIADGPSGTPVALTLASDVSGAGVTISSTGGITQNSGTVDATGGTLSLTATAGSIDFAGTLQSLQGSNSGVHGKIALSAPAGGISETVGSSDTGTINTVDLAASAAGAIDLDDITNTFDAIGPAAGSIAGIASTTGNVTIDDGVPLLVTGDLTATAGSIDLTLLGAGYDLTLQDATVSAGTNTSLTASGGIAQTLLGSISAGSGLSLTAQDGSIGLSGTLTAGTLSGGVYNGNTTLAATGGDIIENGTNATITGALQTGGLAATASATGEIDLEGTNVISTINGSGLSADATGGITLDDTAPLTVSSAVAATGGPVTITDTATGATYALNLGANVTGPSVTLSSTAAGIEQTVGTIDATSGVLTLNADAGDIDFAGTLLAGTLSGGVYSGNVALNASGNILETPSATPTGVIDAGELTGGVSGSGTATFGTASDASAGNQIANLDFFTGGSDLTLVDGQGLTIDADNEGPDLEAAAAAIVAPSLTILGSVDLIGTSVSSLVANLFTIDGSIDASSGGVAFDLLNAGVFNFGAPAVGSASITGTDLDDVTAPIIVFGSTNGTTANAPADFTPATGTWNTASAGNITALEVNSAVALPNSSLGLFSDGSIGGAGNISANNLFGAAGFAPGTNTGAGGVASVSQLGTNQIGNLGAFALYGSGTGSFALDDSSALSVNGPISGGTNNPDITISVTGTAENLTLAGSLTGNDVTLSDNGGSILENATTGALNAGSLSGFATDTVDLGGTNAIGAIGGTGLVAGGAGGITVDDTTALAINAGVTDLAGPVAISIGTGGTQPTLTLAADVTGAGVVLSSTGAITQTAGIANAGGDTLSLTASDGSIGFAGTLESSGGTVALSASGAATETVAGNTTGVIDAGTLSGDVGSALLDTASDASAGNQIAGIGGFNGGSGFTLVNGAALAVAADQGNTPALQAADITIVTPSLAVDAGGTIALTGAGLASLVADQFTNDGSISGPAGSTIALDLLHQGTFNVGTPATGTATIASLAGISAPTIVLGSTNGTTATAPADFTPATGTWDASNAGEVTSLALNSAVTAPGSLGLFSDGTIVSTVGITATDLFGIAGIAPATNFGATGVADVSLLGTNQVPTLGAFALYGSGNGTFAFADSDSLTLSGQITGNPGSPNIDIGVFGDNGTDSAPNTLTLGTAVTGNNVVLETNGTVTGFTGTAISQTSGSLTATGGNLNIVAVNGDIDLGGTVTAGTATGGVYSGTTGLLAETGNINVTGNLQTGILAASASGAIDLDGNNAISTVGASSFTDPFSNDVVGINGLQGGGAVTLDDTLALTLANSVVGTNVALSSAGGGITEDVSGTPTGNIDAATLAVSAAGPIQLDDSGNAIRATGAIGTLTGLTAAGNIILDDTSPLTVSGDVTATGGSLDLTLLGTGNGLTLQNATVLAGTGATLAAPGAITQNGGSLTTSAGTLSLTADAGNIGFSGTLSGGTTTLSATGGGISENATTGALDATTLSGFATDAIDLDGTNAITSIGGSGLAANGAGGILLADNSGLTINSAVTDGAGPVTISDGVNPTPVTLTLGASITGTDVTLSSTGGITEDVNGVPTGAIDAATFAASATGAIDLEGANAITAIGGSGVTAGGAGGIILDDDAALTIDDAVTGTAGPVTISDGTGVTPVTLTLAAGVTGTNVALSSTGGITEDVNGTPAGSISAGSFTASAVDAIDLDGANAISAIGGSGITAGGAGGIILTDTPALTVAGAVTDTAGPVTISDGVNPTPVMLTLGASVTGTDVTLSSTGGITEDVNGAPTGAIDAATFAASATGAIDLEGANAITAIGGSGVTAGGAGGIILDDTAALTIDDAVTATAGPLTISDGDGTPVALVLAADLTGTDVALTSTGGISEDVNGLPTGAIDAGTLAASATGAISLDDPNNQISTIGALGSLGGVTTAGDVAIVDALPLTVSGDLSATGGAIGLTLLGAGNGLSLQNATVLAGGGAAIDAPGSIIQTGGSLTTSAGTLSLTAGGGIALGGTLTAGRLANGAYNGSTALSAAGGDVTDTGALETGTLAVSASGAIDVGGTNVISTVGSANLTDADTGTVTPIQGLTAGSTNGITLADTAALDVAEPIADAAGPVTITDGAGSVPVALTLAADITGSNVAISSTGSISQTVGTIDPAAGNLSLTTAAGSIDFGGTLDGDNVTLSATGGGITETVAGTTSGQLDAGTLGGVASGAIDLAGTNAISAIGTTGVAGLTANGPAGITLDDTLPLTVNDAIAANAGPVTIIDGTPGSVSGLTLAANVTGTDVSLSSTGGIDQTAGTVDSTASPLLLTATGGDIDFAGTLTAGTVEFTATDGSINGTGTLDAGTLAANASGTIDLPSANAIGSTGLTGVTAGGANGITINSTEPLAIDAAVTGDAGDVNITDGPSGTPVALTLAANVTGADVFLSSTGGITQSGGTVDSTVSPLLLTATDGNLTVGGTLAGSNAVLSASGSITGGGLLQIGTLSATAGGTIALTNPANQVGAIAPSGSLGGLTAPGGITLDNAASLTVSGDLTASNGAIGVTLDGAGNSLTLQNSTDTAAGGVTLVTGDNITETGGAITGNAIDIFAPNTITLGGTLTAPNINIGYPTTTAGAPTQQVTFNATTVATGGTLVGRVSVPSPGLANNLPGLFISTDDFTQTGTTMVTPLAGSPSATIEITLNPNPPVLTPTPKPYDAITFAPTGGLDAPAGQLLLSLGAKGTAAGNINVAGLNLYYAGTGATIPANLLGTVAGVGGQAAAGEGFTHALPNIEYQINNCPVQSVDCLLLSPFIVPLNNPVDTVFVGTTRKRRKDEDLSLPDVAAVDY